MATLIDRARIHRIWRAWLDWKFRLFQQHRHRQLTLEYVDGVPILVLADVFNPKLFRTGEALARRLDESVVRPDMKVLDMGTGSGICAVFAARRGAHVVAVDITALAVRCARLNALLNGVERQVEVRHGDLFAPVAGEQFDLIVFNPPYFQGQPEAPWEYAWRSDDVIGRFAAGLPAALKPGGRALVVLSSHATGAHEILMRSGLGRSAVWQRKLIGERLVIVELVSDSAEEPVS